MNRPARFTCLWALLLSAAVTAEDRSPDLLRLTNGELAGRFGGINRDGVLRWERDDGIAPLEFRTDKVRQIILGGAGSDRTGATTSHIELVNGDRIPATITALDDANLSIESSAAGALVIPRDAVRRIAPNPFGGRLIYAGPFDASEWKIDDGKDPEPEKTEAEPEKAGAGEAGAEEVADAGGTEEPVGESEEESAGETSWQHLGSRWYRVSGEDAITLDAGMPRRSVFRFRLEWRGRSPIAIGFHADFAPPPPPDEAEEDGAPKPPVRRIVSSTTRGLTEYFGRALVMTLRGNYVNLYQTGYAPDGEPHVKSLRSSNRTLSIDDNGEADFELRTDLDEGLISLFVDGEFSMQWQLDPFDPEADDLPLPGGGLGFRVDGDKQPMRVSEIFVAEWNGMPDSARSMQSDERDVVLLTNGTDRVSGTVTSITDGQLTLEGPYAPLVIPIEEIADIRFAGKRLRQAPEASDDRIRIHFQPVGRVSGVPGLTRDGTMELKSMLLGELTVALDHAAILEFRQGGNFLDAWDDDF